MSGYYNIIFELRIQHVTDMHYYAKLLLKSVTLGKGHLSINEKMILEFFGEKFLIGVKKISCFCQWKTNENFTSRYKSILCGDMAERSM